jgi:hypothetical protein
MWPPSHNTVKWPFPGNGQHQILEITVIWSGQYEMASWPQELSGEPRESSWKKNVLDDFSGNHNIEIASANDSGFIVDTE